LSNRHITELKIIVIGLPNYTVGKNVLMWQTKQGSGRSASANCLNVGTDIDSCVP